METEIMILRDDPVRLHSAICERIDYYRELYAVYSREGRNECLPRILGSMRSIYSSQGIQCACNENVKFMYLLEGYPLPDQNTISRFRMHRLRDEMERLFRQLAEAGEIDLSIVFIDETKIKTQADLYTFVWKKSVDKKLTKLLEKMSEKRPKLRERNELHRLAPSKSRHTMSRSC